MEYSLVLTFRRARSWMAESLLGSPGGPRSRPHLGI